MKLNITLDDVKDLDGSIKKALDEAVGGLVRTHLQATVDASIKKHSEEIVKRLSEGMERKIGHAVYDCINQHLTRGFGAGSPDRRESVFRESFQKTIEEHFTLKRLEDELAGLAQEYAPKIVRSELSKLVESEFKEVTEGYKKKFGEHMRSFISKFSVEP